MKKLSVLFTILVYYAATGMLLERKPHPTSVLPGAGRMGMAGGVIGLLSSFAAIGGAALTVPFLVKRNVAMHQAIASAAAVGWPLALAGAVGYAVSGFSTPGLPAPSIGYVYLPALFWVAISSMLMAPLGAALAHRMPARALRKVFAILLYALATRMAMSFLGP